MRTMETMVVHRHHPCRPNCNGGPDFFGTQPRMTHVPCGRRRLRGICAWVSYLKSWQFPPDSGCKMMKPQESHGNWMAITGGARMGPLSDTPISRIYLRIREFFIELGSRASISSPFSRFLSMQNLDPKSKGGLDPPESTI